MSLSNIENKAKLILCNSHSIIFFKLPLCTEPSRLAASLIISGSREYIIFALNLRK